MNKNLGAIILAAGKGKRMQLDSVNKVTIRLGEKSIISHIVNFIKKLGIGTIVVVVGHHKQSVINSLSGESVIFAEQEKQLGTGHALMRGLKELPKSITDVLVVYGDDAILYSEKNQQIVDKLLELHRISENVATFLTIEHDNPSGLGRIIRDKNGKMLAIAEEKDATEKELKITEVNPGCFIFSVDFLKKYLARLEKSSATEEYYLTNLIDLAVKNKERVEVLRGGKLSWRGINTEEELDEAKKLYYGK